MKVAYNETLAEKPSHSHASLKKYVLGYVASLVLTVIALWLVLTHGFSRQPLTLMILLLAALQVIVQLFLFMHVTEGDDGPPFHSVAVTMGFLFTLIFVLGSVWVMSFHSAVS
ncbi:MAG: cytochrome C oxidase subunit IV family protein [Thermoflavifilum sp.]|nr:cytochrome C oxidase subunit IV family protein [Thermoflavifilum sp.]MCL6513471.1 cytochrome C oxidase subunit IV family protein [Alicyclobacillus sp.]